jgi:hypothetical protein
MPEPTTPQLHCCRGGRRISHADPPNAVIAHFLVFVPQIVELKLRVRQSLSAEPVVEVPEIATTSSSFR